MTRKMYGPKDFVDEYVDQPFPFCQRCGMDMDPGIDGSGDLCKRCTVQEREAGEHGRD